MNIKLKLAITILAVLIVAPLTHYLYVVWNFTIELELEIFYKYAIITLVDWVICFPVLFKLLDIAARKTLNIE